MKVWFYKRVVIKLVIDQCKGVEICFIHDAIKIEWNFKECPGSSTCIYVFLDGIKLKLVLNGMMANFKMICNYC